MFGFGKKAEMPEEEVNETPEAEKAEGEDKNAEAGIEVCEGPVEEVVLENQPEESGSTVTIIEGADGEAGSEREVETTSVDKGDGENLTLEGGENDDEGDPMNSIGKAA